MAITRVQSKTATTGATNASSTTIVFDSTPTAGNILAVAVATDNAGGPSCVATNIQFYEAFRTGSNAALVHFYIGRVFASPSATVTLTAITSQCWAISGAEYSGANLLRLDKMVTAAGSSTSPASGATSTTATADELWLGAIGARGTSANTMSSPTNSFTIVGQTNSTNGTTNNDRTVGLLERIVSSTGTANAGCTIASSNNWAAIALTFEETPAAGGAHSFAFGG